MSLPLLKIVSYESIHIYSIAIISVEPINRIQMAQQVCAFFRCLGMDSEVDIKDHNSKFSPPLPSH